MSKELIHALILIITIGLSFLFPQTTLAQYDLQIGAILFIIMFIAKKLYLPKHPKSTLLESVVFTFITLTIINTSGGVKSPLFFLVYFLLFSLSLLLEPVISITASFTLILFFLLSLPEGQTIKSLLPVFSLAFLTPFALALAQEHNQIQKLKRKYQDSTEETLLFLSLTLKSHLKNIEEAVTNFMGDEELAKIRRQVKRMKTLIDQFEKNRW